MGLGTAWLIKCLQGLRQRRGYNGVWRWGLWEVIGLDEVMWMGPHHGIRKRKRHSRSSETPYTVIARSSVWWWEKEMHPAVEGGHSDGAGGQWPAGVSGQEPHGMKYMIEKYQKQRHYFANKGPSSQGYGFSSSHVWLWELDCEESWVSKNWCFWTVVLEKTLESPLNCKEIQPLPPKAKWGIHTMKYY